MNLTSCNSTKKLHKQGDAQSPLFDNSFWSLACVPGKVSHKYGPLIKSLRRDEGEKGKQAEGGSGSARSAGEALSLWESKIRPWHGQTCHEFLSLRDFFFDLTGLRIHGARVRGLIFTCGETDRS